MPEATITDAGSAIEEIEAEIGFALARNLSAADLDVSLRRRVKAAVEPILEDLIAARKERNEAREEIAAVERALEGVEETPLARRVGHWIGVAADECTRARAAEAEAVQLRSRLLQAEIGGEAMNRNAIADRMQRASPDLTRLDAECAAEAAFPECLALNPNQEAGDA